MVSLLPSAQYLDFSTSRDREMGLLYDALSRFIDNPFDDHRELLLQRMDSFLTWYRGVQCAPIVRERSSFISLLDCLVILKALLFCLMWVAGYASFPLGIFVFILGLQSLLTPLFYRRCSLLLDCQTGVIEQIQQMARCIEDISSRNFFLIDQLCSLQEVVINYNRDVLGHKIFYATLHFLFILLVGIISYDDINDHRNISWLFSLEITMLYLFSLEF